MVVLEALSYGLAIISTDVYALREMVLMNKNGVLINPPVSNWDNVLPSKFYYNYKNAKKHILETDTRAFEANISSEIERFILDKNWRYKARTASVKLMSNRFITYE